MTIHKNPFRVEDLRAKLANELKFSQLIKTYSKSYPEIKDQNTPKLWDHLNIEARTLIDNNPMEEARLNFVSSLIKGDKIKVLDVGFGSASLEQKYFNTNSGKKVEWFGTEISNKSIKRAQKQFPKIEFRLGKISNIKYPNNKFDYVVALEVLEHIKPSETFKALREIFRVVKPGKYFIVSVPLNEGLEEMVSRGENPNAHVRTYTPDLIKAELQIVGFAVIKEKKIFAFNSHHAIKSFVAQYILPKKFKHNNIIIMAQKQL